MGRQTQTSTPSDDDWRDSIAAFKRHRDLDGKKFREGAEQLIPELRREAASAYDTAARMERREHFDVFAHDGAAIIRSLEKTGHTEQLALAGLDLLRLDLSAMPTSAVVVVTPDEVAAGGIKDWRDRIRSGVDEQEVARRLRTQAERLLEGVKRVQSCLNNYKQRLATIKPATSVAWDVLFETTESWRAPPKEIARRIAAGVRHPKMTEDHTHDDHVGLWHENVRTRLSDWRKRHAPPEPAVEQPRRKRRRKE